MNIDNELYTNTCNYLHDELRENGALIDVLDKYLEKHFEEGSPVWDSVDNLYHKLIHRQKECLEEYDKLINKR